MAVKSIWFDHRRCRVRRNQRTADELTDSAVSSPTLVSGRVGFLFNVYPKAILKGNGSVHNVRECSPIRARCFQTNSGVRPAEIWDSSGRYRAKATRI